MKNVFRRKVIQDRKSKPLNEISNYSKDITSKFLNLPEVQKASTIMIYLDFNNEVQTTNLAYELLKLNKKVLIPITIKAERKLIPSEIKDINNELKIGTYGIREPKHDYIRPTDINSIDLVVVPAVAFDLNKYRLGYGGGFYDRFIENLRVDAITIGLAFESQIFESIPKEDHDAKLNYIITEKRIIK